MQIFIKSERTIAYDVEQTCTVLELKQEIMQKLGWPVSLQRLVYAGKMLENKKTLKDYDITKEATIYLSHRMKGGERMRIYVSYAGKKVTLYVEETWKIAECRISAEGDVIHEIPAPYMLTYMGRVLEHDKTLAYYSIPNDAELKCLPRILGGSSNTVRTPSQRKQQLITTISQSYIDKQRLDAELNKLSSRMKDVKQEVEESQVDYQEMLNLKVLTPKQETEFKALKEHLTHFIREDERLWREHAAVGRELEALMGTIKGMESARRKME